MTLFVNILIAAVIISWSILFYIHMFIGIGCDKGDMQGYQPKPGPKPKSPSEPKLRDSDLEMLKMYEDHIAFAKGALEYAKTHYQIKSVEFFSERIEDLNIKIAEIHSKQRKK